MNADDVLRKGRQGKDAPQPDAMLQEAEWLNEDGVGRHLNFMSSLYYEVTPEAPEDDEDGGDDGAG